MKFIIGRKEGMSQIFTPAGAAVPVTVITASPLIVTQLKDEARDGYRAVQVGLIKTKGDGTKPAAVGVKRPAFILKREWRLPAGAGPSFTLGQAIAVDVFAPNDRVRVSGLSKGKGFQGVVKRHGFAGGPRTHGQKHSEREPGSIGGGLRTRVPKGMRMAGRMGGRRATTKNLRVMAVDAAARRLLVAGAVPGRRGTWLEISTV